MMMHMTVVMMATAAAMVVMVMNNYYMLMMVTIGHGGLVLGSHELQSRLLPFWRRRFLATCSRWIPFVGTTSSNSSRMV